MNLHLALAVLLPLAVFGNKFQKPGGSDENDCELISSRGLMYSCDVRPHPAVNAPWGGSDATELMLLQMNATSLEKQQETLGMQHYPAEIAAHGDGVIVYVCTTALPAFISQVLPGISKSFKLVTGDSDSGPINVLGLNGFKMLVNHKKLIHWFGQNAVDGETANPKFTQTPIGLDYHSLKTKNMRWGSQASPTKQEAELLAKRSTAPEFAHRSPKAFWCGSSSHSRRTSAAHKLPSSFVDSAPPLGRSAFWDNVARHQFVISPPGNGFDCHRTWEAIALGSIPIVSNRLNSLYVENGFSVVAIGDNEWAQLASPAMQNRLKKVAAKAQKTMPPAMYLKYWMQKIRQA